MAISKLELNAILVKSFPDAEIYLEDFMGDEDHYNITLIDPIFDGISIVDQHRMVNNALSEILKNRLHAITINTKSK